MLDVFQSIKFSSYNVDRKTKTVSPFYGVRKMTEKKMMIQTGPRYPSEKLSFSIANLTKDKPIRFFNLLLNFNEQFDVDLVLEDSHRNLLSSFISFFI